MNLQASFRSCGGFSGSSQGPFRGLGFISASAMFVLPREAVQIVHCCLVVRTHLHPLCSVRDVGVLYTDFGFTV